MQNSRKKLPPDWHKRVAIIQSSVTAAVKELPAGLLTQLPGGADAPMDYFRCRMVRDKLAETADRSLFGGLTGTAGVWDKIVKAYEKDCEWRHPAACHTACWPPPVRAHPEHRSTPPALPFAHAAAPELQVVLLTERQHFLLPPAVADVYVGEAAQAMIQNVDFEIPYLRKQAAKFSQQIADGEKRDIEYNKSAATCAANYKQVGGGWLLLCYCLAADALGH